MSMKIKVLTNRGHNWWWGVDRRNLNPLERVLRAAQVPRENQAEPMA